MSPQEDTTTGAQLIISDQEGSSLLMKTFSTYKFMTIQHILRRELFDHLDAIKKLNILYDKLSWQSKYYTAVFNLATGNKLTFSSVIKLIGEKEEQRFHDIRIHQIQFPEECKFPAGLGDYMKKLQRMCDSFGQLKAFHYTQAYSCHIGGYEKSIYCFGLDGVFLLEFYSDADW